jgi:hypothetical protein
MSDLVLSAAELYALTGYQMPKYQIKWLLAEGFKHRVGADGHPRVDRDHYRKVMGGEIQKERKKTEPDFSGLLKSVRTA